MENHEKHSLGSRAFLVFLARRIKFAIFLFVLAGAVWYAERWFSGVTSIWWDYAAELMTLAAVAYFLGILILTYLEYRYYTYFFTDEAFVVTNGYVVRNEIAALYHQIQNVNVSRSILDRSMGVSRVIIVMIGSNNDSSPNQIILEAIGKKKAKLIQQEILVRARQHTVQRSS